MQCHLVLFFSPSTKHQTAAVCERLSERVRRGLQFTGLKETSLKFFKSNHRSSHGGEDDRMQCHLVRFSGPSTKYQTATIPCDRLTQLLKSSAMGCNFPLEGN